MLALAHPFNFFLVFFVSCSGYSGRIMDTTYENEKYKKRYENLQVMISPKITKYFRYIHFSMTR